MNQNQCTWWDQEIKERGAKNAFLDRLRFHSGMTTEMIRSCTYLSVQTIRKHMHRLVQEGLAIEDTPDHWRIVVKPS